MNLRSHSRSAGPCAMAHESINDAEMRRSVSQKEFRVRSSGFRGKEMQNLKPETPKLETEKAPSGNFLYLVGPKYRQTVFDRRQEVAGRVSGDNMHEVHVRISRAAAKGYGSRVTGSFPRDAKYLVWEKHWFAAQCGRAPPRESEALPPVGFGDPPVRRSLTALCGGKAAPVD